jgi:PAT family beta-lactamase induction signal transducer AmpG
MDRRVITMLALGFSAGLPILLIFSTLSLWLKEAGMARADITMLSWAGLGYAFKYIWAPIIDRMPAPWLTEKMGQRRSWLLIAQFAVMAAILGMAWTDPASSPVMIAIFAVMLGFSSATQDIVIDAFRIEIADADFQAFLSSTYIAGYRVAMLAATAGAFFIADWLGTTEDNYVYSAWAWTYTIMASLMLVGVITTLMVSEPARLGGVDDHAHKVEDHVRFFLVFVVSVIIFVVAYKGMSGTVATLKPMLTDVVGKALSRTLVETLRLAISVGAAFFTGRILLQIGAASKEMVTDAYVGPIKNFFDRYAKHAVLILCMIAVYRSSDIIMGAVANLFYVDVGFTKVEVGTIAKLYGFWMTIIGTFVGGFMGLRYGVIKVMFVGAVLSAATNVLFVLLVSAEGNLWMLTAVISADNLSAGIATAAFVAYLSALTNVKFTATQYALFSSIMLLLPKLFAGYSGGMVDVVGYETFFIGTAILGIPVAILVLYAGKYSKIDEPSD